MDRRKFLGSAAVGAATILSRPGELWGDPYAPGGPSGGVGDGGAEGGLAGQVVRVRGVVRGEGGRGVSGVAVSDGLRVTSTGGDGTFELVTTTRERFVHVSLPSGYRIPVSAAGTALHYRPIRPDARGEMEAVFELEPDRRGDGEHAFLLLADPQTQNARDMALFHGETVPDARATVQRLGDVSVFGIGCGDLLWDDLSMFPDYERAVRTIGVPFFQVLGNHDLDLNATTTEASSTVFRSHFGPEHYSFERGDVHYCVLNNVFWHGAGYVGYVPDHQLEWLRQDLARVEPGCTSLSATRWTDGWAATSPSAIRRRTARHSTASSSRTGRTSSRATCTRRSTSSTARRTSRSTARCAVRGGVARSAGTAHRTDTASSG